MPHIRDIIEAEFPDLLPVEWNQMVAQDAVLCRAYLIAFAQKDDEVSGTAGIGAEVLQEFRRVLEKINKPPTRDNKEEIIAAAFKSAYNGLSADGLFEHLSWAEQQYRTPGTTYYARIVPFVQSSGTGKTRTLLELANKGVIVLYMNLREPSDEVAGDIHWPPPTPFVSDWLNGYDGNAQEHLERCIVFLSSIFNEIKDALEKLHAKYSTPKEVVAAWSRRMVSGGWSHARTKFFRSVDRRSQIMRSARDGYSNHIQDVKTDYNIIAARASLAVGLALKELIKSFSNFFEDGRYEPKLVIALDDVQFIHRTTDEGFRPSKLLFRAISLVTQTHSRIWFVPASTNAWITDIDVQTLSSGTRWITTGGPRLFHPYCLIDWDRFGPVLQTLLEHPEQISTARSLMRFGRALWYSLRGLPLEELVRLARLKLTGTKNTEDDLCKSYHALAILSQRLGLRVTLGHQEGTPFLDDAVANHLRILLGSTKDGKTRFTAYSSEPFLSHIAAELLEQEPSLFDVLREKLENGLIEREDHGRLACRILLLVGKDVCLRAQYARPAGAPANLDNELFYCRSVPLLAYLETLFGPKIYPEDEEARSAVEADFNTARVNFSHWIPMSGAICSAERADWNCKAWLFRHYARTSSVQCPRDESYLDQVIPLYFDDATTSPDTMDRMSLIMVSTNATEDSCRNRFGTIHRKDPAINCVTDKPSVTLLLDIGLADSDVSSMYDIRPALKDRCWHIYVSGVTLASLPFLDQLGTASLQSVLRKLTESSSSLLDELLARTQFGASSSPANMAWDDPSEENAQR